MCFGNLHWLMLLGLAAAIEIWPHDDPRRVRLRLTGSLADIRRILVRRRRAGRASDRDYLRELHL